MDQQPLTGIYQKVHVPHQLLPDRGIITELYRNRGDDRPPVLGHWRGHFLLILSPVLCSWPGYSTLKAIQKYPSLSGPSGLEHTNVSFIWITKKSKREYCLPEELLMDLRLERTYCCVRLSLIV